jgi:hypothetical protein
MAKGKLVKRFKRRKARTNPAPSAPRRNPPLLADVGMFVAPAFAGFAATRFATRVASTQVAKRWPKLGKHAGVVASVGSFLSAWYLANKVKMLAPYQMALVAGSGIATGQTIVQTYLPGLAWIVSDATPELANSSQQQVSSGNGQRQQAADDGFEFLDESTGSWRNNLDASDPGRYAQAPHRHRGNPVQSPPAGSASDDGSIDDMLVADDEFDVQFGSLG